jgi:DNA-binding SARP family transcriptional activator
MLRIRTLGASEITIEGTRIGAEQPIAFALLFVLAMRESAVARRDVASLLWPAVRDVDRNHRLRSLLHRLRRVGAPLLCSGTTIALTHAAIDFREFISGPLSLDDARVRGQRVGTVLPGLTAPNAALADCFDDARDVIVATVTRWLNRAMELAKTAGDWRLLEQLARVARALDVGNEIASLNLAEAQCLTGDATAGLATLDELEACGIDDTLSFAAARLRRRLVHQIAARDSGEIPLIGRDDVMRRLWTALSRARSGRGSGVLLWGPAGIGKTRILDELARLSIDDFTYIRLAARPVHALRPMGLLVDVTEQLFDAPGAAGCDPAAYSALKQRLVRAKPNDTLRDDESLFDELVELLAAITDDAPLLLAIDDMHVVDPAIWRFLRALTAWSFDRRLLWIFSYRAQRESEIANRPEDSVIQRIPLRPHLLAARYDRDAAGR